MAQARCATDTSIESGWSDSLTVTISAAGPDLTGEWVLLSQNCKKGKCKISGTIKIENKGNQGSSFTFVDFYLSDDATYDEGDTQLKRSSTGKIKAGRSKVIRLSYNFPKGQNAMDKYIIAVIDPGNLVTETDETNNTIVYGPIP
jgi:hypothetical protein